MKDIILITILCITFAFIAIKVANRTEYSPESCEFYVSDDILYIDKVKDIFVVSSESQGFIVVSETFFEALDWVQNLSPLSSDAFKPYAENPEVFLDTVYQRELQQRKENKILQQLNIKNETKESN